MMVNTKWSSWQGDFNTLVSDDWVVYKEGYFYTIENKEGYILHSVFTRIESCIDYCDWFKRSKPRLKYRGE